jgi:serralysin
MQDRTSAAAARAVDLSDDLNSILAGAGLKDLRVRTVGSDAFAAAPAPSLGGALDLTQANTNAALGLTSAGSLGDLLQQCGCPGCLKSWDGAGVQTADTTAALTTDNIGDTIATAADLEVGADPIVSTIDTLGDVDFFRVELVEGQLYDFGMYAKVGGPSGTPNADSYLDLYDADGNLLVNADGGKPGDNLGLDALLTYKAEATGVYYLRASAFDQAETGPGGDSVGDYEMFARESNSDPNAYSYKPYYSPNSPLHSIDWGTQIDRTSRNPDGDQGPRDNGEPFTGTGWDPSGIQGKNVVTYYLARQGEVYTSEDPTNPGLTTDMVVPKNWNDWEREAIRNAFDEYEEVADVVYIEVQDRYQADFKILSYYGTPGPGGSVLGRASPPDTPNEGQMEFNAGDERWDENGLTQGGFFFSTILHEFGHAHGMAHPHDNGGHSSVMRGAGGTLGGGTGDFDLSQRIYTVMSYNSEWVKSPYGNPTDDTNYGWVGSLSPFDIAVIQDKYGVNEDTNTGNDVYVLKDVNAEGTFFDSIWDCGGRDAIKYEGARDCNIDLRAASLEYEFGGGGWISYAYGIHGGYTIANSVTIENGFAGEGDDVLNGNDVRNILQAAGGDDRIIAAGGRDVLNAGAGGDVLLGGDGNDMLIGGLGRDVLRGGEGADRFLFRGADIDRDRIMDLEAGDIVDLARVDANRTLAGNQAFTFVGAFSGAAGEAVLDFEAAKNTTRVLFDTNGDREADFILFLEGDQTGFTGFIA